MVSFILTSLVLLVIATIVLMCRTSLEPFEDVKMRPWFGYEPGFGPGWGRKGCCNTDTHMPQ